MGEDLQFCPNCKKSVARNNFTVHTVHCHRNIISCSLCQEPVVRSQYQIHVEVAHTSVPCEQCKIQVEASNLFCHQRELCPKRLLVCKFCELELAALDLEDHLEFCGARTERCKGCSKYVQLKHLQFHYEHDHKYLSPVEKEKAKADGDSGDEGEECPICLGPVTLPITLACGHMFCMVCVKGIANTTKNCAICRRDIERDMLMDIRFCREEDVIKNYVNNPKYKKIRSKSVPSRTTQDYDDMVSALLSSRTSSSSVRYQRPNNSHTPASYTPYCYANSQSTDTACTDSFTNNNDSTSTSYSGDDCCCSTSSNNTRTSPPVSSKDQSPPLKNSSNTSSFAHRPKSAAPQPTSNSTRSTSVPPTRLTSTTSTSTELSTSRPISYSQSVLPSNTYTVDSSASKRPINERTTPEKSSRHKANNSAMPPKGSRPRRPTTLALNQGDGANCQDGLSQEECDRLLAFQIAQDEDEAMTTEMSKQRVPFRRSHSMPERKQDSASTSDEGESSGSPRNGSVENRMIDGIIRNPSQSGLPPASPRCSSATPSSTGTNGCSTSSRGASLTKSSSDSSANGGGATKSGSGSALNTGGARPKSSTGLKKRVSFKEDPPPVRRQAPVMLPCEFCDEVFPERDLMRHQTSCDNNETKYPHEYLLARRSSVASPTSPLSSPSGAPPPISPSKPPTSRNRSSESPSTTSTTLRNFKTPPQSPSPRPRTLPSPTPPRSPSSSSSPHLNHHSGGYDSNSSRNDSLSPGPAPASTSGSSGVGSSISSVNSSSVSTTPSTSSSASPVHVATASDTPTDIEADFEEEEQTIVKPRKGRLLSSAICSWRTISGSLPKDKPKYARSQTAPIEPNSEIEPETSQLELSSSKSASKLNCKELLKKEAVKEENKVGVSEENAGSNTAPKTSSQNGEQPVFIKSKNKQPAPPPPVVPRSDFHREMEKKAMKQAAKMERKSETDKMSGDSEGVKNLEKQTSTFKFDSIPVMNGSGRSNVEKQVPCNFCKKIFSPEKFRNHKTVCEVIQKKAARREEMANKSKSSKEPVKANPPSDSCEGTPAPSRHNKGPAPQPPASACSATTSGRPASPTRHPGREKSPAASTEADSTTQTSMAKSGFSKRRANIERSHSVREAASSFRRRYQDFEFTGHALQRANSIKETSRKSYDRSKNYSPPRRWLSREVLSNGLDNSRNSLSSGPSLSSSSTSLNNCGSGGSTAGHGWSTHVSMIRDDARSRRAATALGNGAFSSQASAYYGGSSRFRDRSISRPRPSSLYSTSSFRSALYI